ncbi:MAG: hypothetical protein ACTXOO_04980 [Sodalis sp. (in: enterobacteria)]
MFEVALSHKPSKRVYDRIVDRDAEAHLIALSCSNPLEGPD